MSGFEITGVILGSIPLVVSALEHYADGVQNIKSMLHYEEVFVDIVVDLATSQSRFKQSCEELLQSLLLTDNQFRDLVEEQRGWDNVELEMKIKSRLGDDFAVYKLKVNRLGKRIELLRRKLKLPEDFSVPFLKDGRVDQGLQKDFFKTWRRLRGGFNAERHKALGADIRDDVDQIRDLTRGAIDLEDSRRQRLPSAASMYWESFREHSLHLFDALCTMWPRTCSSHIHSANLPLHFPSLKTLEKADSDLNVSLSHKMANAPTESDTDWWEINFSWIQSPSQKSNRTSISNPEPRPNKKSARFAPNPASKMAPSCQSPQRLCRSSRPISNLCLSLQQNPHVDCLGYLICQTHDYHIHDAKALQPGRNLIPLWEMFHRSDRIGLSTKERCSYAVSLAAAVLHLYNTSWLNSSWGLQDVFFDGDNGRLYIIKDFKPPTGTALPCHPRINVPPVKNKWIFALGVALMELSYGKPLEFYRTDADLDTHKREHQLTRYSIALRLMGIIKEKESANFAKAVCKCIEPTSDTGDFELSNDAFRNQFYVDVVAPLKQDYEFLFN